MRWPCPISQEEPGVRGLPIPIDGLGGDVQDIGCFVHGQAAKDSIAIHNITSLVKCSEARTGRWAISRARVSCCRMARHTPNLAFEGFKLAVDCAEAGDFDAAFEHLQRLIDARA